MKKILVMTVSAIFLCNVWMASYSQAFIYTHLVRQIASSSAQWLTGAGMRVPAYVEMVGSSATGALKWIPLMIPQARAAKIAANVIGFAGSALVAYGAHNIIEWMQANDWDYVASSPSSVYQGDTYYNPSNEAFESLGYSLDDLEDHTIYQNLEYPGYNNPISCYPDTNAAWDAMSSYQTGCHTWEGYVSASSGYGANAYEGWHSWYLTINRYIDGSQVYRTIQFCFPVSSAYTLIEVTPDPVYAPAEIADIEDDIYDDLMGEDPLAIAAALESLDFVEEGLDNNAGIAHQNNTMWQVIEESLNDSITTAQKDALEAEAVDVEEWAEQAGEKEDAILEGIDAMDIRQGVLAALELQGLSQAEIQTAVSLALQENSELFGGIAVVEDITEAIMDAYEDAGNLPSQIESVTLSDYPEPTEPGAVPDKSLITTVLTNFMTGISSLPVMSLLNDLEISAGGSSSVTLNIPGFLGGSSQDVTIDFSQWATQFQFMGSILLMLCGIRWSIWLFK